MFDQRAYWVDRHKKFVGDPRSVGNLGLSLEENMAGEAGLKTTMAQAAALLKPARTVLDVGCGYGRVCEGFTSARYDYVGVDVSPEAIRKAREDNPHAQFKIGDLASWQTPHQYDVVVVLYVFIHFVEDVAWRSMLDRALSWVAPHGALLFADHFPVAREQPAPHVTSRPLQDYEDIFRVSGFHLDNAFSKSLIQSVGKQYASHVRLARQDSD